ncbi:hypothetical protein KKF34_17990 [Myxococcota bacterium]|nr:hypothetical protein [Myxococcota bacterium]MBU1379891.1 hypothetical protein [Myxococcota bacterium]MBU1498776.1 hypothetical protein [Myxococcota bacterium]
MISRKLIFIKVTLLLFFLRVLDLFITWRVTPDLEHEVNPLVRWFNAGWPAFITVQFLLFTAVSFCFAWYLWGRDWRVEKKGLGYLQFINQYYFKWKESSKEAHLKIFCFVLPVASIFVSIAAIIHNLLLVNKIETYVFFLYRFHRIAIPAAALGIVFLSAHLAFRIEFRRYNAQFN